MENWQHEIHRYFLQCAAREEREQERLRVKGDEKWVLIHGGKQVAFNAAADAVKRWPALHLDDLGQIVREGG